MNRRNCEVKLVDVMVVKRNSRTNKGNIDKIPLLNTKKTDVTCENEKFPQKKKFNKYKHTEEDLHNAEEKTIRPSQKTHINNLHLEDLQNKQIKIKEKAAGTVGNESCLPDKSTIRKRKSSLIDIENATVNKKLNIKHFISSSTASKQNSTSNNESNKQIKQKKRSYRKIKLSWENKLTGARRVSKRLSNMKIKQNKFKVSDVEIERHCHSAKKKQEKVNYKIEKKSKAIKIKYNKYKQNIEPEARKSVLYRVPPQERTNHSELNHTKKFHPRVTQQKQFKETAKISSENIKSGVNEQFSLYNISVSSVNKCSSKAENKINNRIPHEVSNSSLFSENSTDIEMESDQHSDTAEQQNLVILNDHPLNEESNVILVQSDDLQCSHSIDETNEQSVYNEGDSVSCSEVIIIDIKSDGNVSNEHFEECELFSTTLDNNDQTREKTEIIDGVNTSEKETGPKTQDDVGTSNSSDLPEDICQELEIKKDKVVTTVSDDSSSKPDTKFEKGISSDIQNKQVSTLVDDCIQAVDTNTNKQIETDGATESVS
ncbi:uncharacterized protein LOC124362799 [Homalodisca vitripennis]|uniref:uncharacterized protein LOC124362799 n=1 Tax=Homalodisca vitripennis TaxID=197043 RepID=UPI001EEB3456|nr:uncharacterized protein LOC124362799 [Homalodisca vitripennis]XP_046673566.1 uncharacterized protein LOC124362799 [Homalodisca vitripennis]